MPLAPYQEICSLLFMGGSLPLPSPFLAARIASPPHPCRVRWCIWRGRRHVSHRVAGRPRILCSPSRGLCPRPVLLWFRGMLVWGLGRLATELVSLTDRRLTANMHLLGSKIYRTLLGSAVLHKARQITLCSGIRSPLLVGAMSTVDPILATDSSRFVLFPIRYPKVRCLQLCMCNAINRLGAVSCGAHTSNVCSRSGPPKRSCDTLPWISFTDRLSWIMTKGPFCRPSWHSLPPRTGS